MEEDEVDEFGDQQDARRGGRFELDLVGLVMRASPDQLHRRFEIVRKFSYEC